MNPYSGANFFEFFLIFFSRLPSLFVYREFVSDEVQIFTFLSVSINASLVGVFLLLRRMTMLANSLSHTILLGIVVVFWMFGALKESAFYEGVPLHLSFLSALLTALFTTFFVEALSKNVRLQEDAALSLVFTSLFALGIFLVTLLFKNAHIGSEIVMGSSDSLSFSDLPLSFLVLFLNLFVLFLFFKEFVLTTFDTRLAFSLGVSPAFFNYLLMTQVALTIVSSFKAVGVLMVLSFLTGPPLIASLLTKNLKKQIFLAVLTASLISLFSVALARHLLSIYDLPLSTGGLTVSMIGVSFLLASFFRKR